jgi:predicted SAM-dependent methyltransferase
MGGIETLAEKTETFDLVTLSHVIEHLYDPIDVLKTCHKILKPGGRLWLETPNLESKGHEIFGKDWRDLDPPRHLLIFNRSSLIKAIGSAGFTHIEDEPYRPLCKDIFAASEAIAKGLDPIDNPKLSIRGQKLAKQIEKQAKREPAIREYITIITLK